MFFPFQIFKMLIVLKMQVKSIILLSLPYKSEKMLLILTETSNFVQFHISQMDTHKIFGLIGYPLERAAVRHMGGDRHPRHILCGGCR